VSRIRAPIAVLRSQQSRPNQSASMGSSDNIALSATADIYVHMVNESTVAKSVVLKFYVAMGSERIAVSTVGGLVNVNMANLRPLVKIVAPKNVSTV